MQSPIFTVKADLNRMVSEGPNNTLVSVIQGRVLEICDLDSSWLGARHLWFGSSVVKHLVGPVGCPEFNSQLVHFCALLPLIALLVPGVSSLVLLIMHFVVNL